MKLLHRRYFNYLGQKERTARYWVAFAMGVAFAAMFVTSGKPLDAIFSLATLAYAWAVA